ncbi:MAG: hypothetical protein AAF926_04140, partial [Pseudomonadota bacterium]
PKLNELLRERDTLTERLKTYLSKEQEALLNQRQAEAASENVRVISKATYPVKGRNMRALGFVGVTAAWVFTLMMLALFRVFADPRLYATPSAVMRVPRAQPYAEPAAVQPVSAQPYAPSQAYRPDTYPSQHGHPMAASPQPYVQDAPYTQDLSYAPEAPYETDPYGQAPVGGQLYAAPYPEYPQQAANGPYEPYQAASDPYGMAGNPYLNAAGGPRG